MNDIRRYYEILEVTPQTSPALLRQAYEDLLQAWDPKAFSKDPDLKRKAEKKVKEIHEAYRKILLFSASSSKIELNGRGPLGTQDAAFGTDHQTTDRATIKEGRSNYLRIHPWLRLFARMVDYLLFVSILQTVGFFQIPLFQHIPVFFLPVITTFCWVFVEALLLRCFGTTMGKWIFNIEVIDRFLKKPEYKSAWLRSLSVWCNGLGTGFFLIAPATLIVSYVRLRRERIAPWDRTGKFRMIHRKFKRRKLITAGFLAAAVLVSALQLETGHQKTIRRRASQVETGNGEATHTTPATTAPGSETTKMYGNSGRPISNQTPISQANEQLLGGRYDEAAKAYRSIIAMNPNKAEARYGLGVSYAKMNLFAAAEGELKKSIRIAPKYAEAHHILGLVYVNLGNKEAALAQYQTLLDLDEKLAEELNGYIRNMDNLTESGRAPSR